MKAQIFNCSWWVPETREKELDRALEAALKLSKFNILRTVEYEFSPYGYTKLWLLGESHLALHTFPEEGKAYVELSSCNKAYYEKFVETMRQLYKGVD